MSIPGPILVEILGDAMKTKPVLEQVKQNWRRIAGWLFAILLIILVAYYGLQPIIAKNNKPVKLIVYAFSTQQEVFSQEIFPIFKEAWENETGQAVTIEAIFGPSGTLAGQINLGAPADIAVFSHVEHINWLKVSRMVKQDNQPLIIGYTPIVILVRPGNPAGITNFDDLTQPGLAIIHPDPRSSGGGEWGVLAAYGNTYLDSQDQAAAEKQVKDIWENVRILAPSARTALTLFELGAGDALITYEQDARLALERGVALEIVVPTSTILTQPAAVIVDENVKRSEQSAAQAFLDFLASDLAQTMFNRYQLRTKSSSDQYPPLINPFTIQDMGNWPQAYSDVIEALWQTEIEPRLSLDSETLLLETGD